MFPLTSPINIPVRQSARLNVEQNRERIAATALAMIVEGGVPQLNIAEVCEAAKISRATLYRYFSGIDDILEGVIELVIERFSRELDAAIADNPEIDNRIDVVFDHLGSELSLEFAQKLQTSDRKFTEELARRTRKEALLIFNKVMAPVYDQTSKLLNLEPDAFLINETMSRLHVSLSMFSDYGFETSPADLMKSVFRSLLVSAPPRKISL